MAKIIAWLILILIVLLALRLVNARKARRTPAPPMGDPEPMVRCDRCGVFVPRSDARKIAGGFTCAEDSCLERRSR